MAGIDTDIEGEARPQPGIKIGFLSQEPQLDPAKDVRGNVDGRRRRHIRAGRALQRDQRQVRRTRSRRRRDEQAARRAGEAAGRDRRRAAAGSSSASSKSRPTRCACRRGTPTSRKISGGERRRVALCRLLLSQPDMLLLDEPTNHLDAESVAWLERYLEEYPGTVIAVTHDRYFLDNVAGWILELDRGHGIPWQGNYSSWLEQKEQRLAIEEKQQEGLRKTLRARARVGARESRRRARPRARRACALRRARRRRNSRSATRPTRSTFRRARGSAIW